jgi:thioredoxin reductase (NADPH)
MLEPTLIAGMQPGGQLTITTEVENYPGFAEAIQGPWLMDQMQEQARALGTNFVTDTIANVDLSRRPFTLLGDSGDVYTADTLIIATGASANWLGLPSENQFQGFGVSACATCDGFFYRGKEVAVVGGGNTAVEEALFLTNFADKVTLVHRRDFLRADKTNQARLAANKKINVLYDTQVAEVLGTQRAQGRDPASSCANTVTGSLRDPGGAWIVRRHRPFARRPGLFRGQLEMDESGYIKTAPDSTHTSVAGVFAAGDVKDKIFRQAVTAAGMGCMAALEAERFLAGSHARGFAAQRLRLKRGKLWIGTSFASSTPWLRGSFTHAGQSLGLSQSAVSRQISALEEEISTPLFQRHARGLTLPTRASSCSPRHRCAGTAGEREEALKNVHERPRGR